jgi:ABC-type uncharacterized transport system ATPase subunit
MFDGIWDLSEHYLARPAGDGEPILEARNVTVKFGEIVAVNDVSVSVRRGRYSQS